MDIARCRCEFSVPHNFLNYGRCDIAQSQRSCGGVAAGVRREVSASGIFYSSMIFQIELVTIHAEDVIFPAVGVIAEFVEHGSDGLWKYHGRFLPLSGFEASPPNFTLVKIYHILFQDE